MSTVHSSGFSSPKAAIALALLLTVALAGPTLATPGGNSAAAEACEDGGYVDWTDVGGGPFRNEGACVSYAARGGTLVPVVVNPFAVSYRASGVNGFVATVTGTGMDPDSTVDITFVWDAASFTLGYAADPSGQVAIMAGGVCSNAGSPLTGIFVGATPAGGSQTEYSLPLPDASVCPPPA